MSVHEITSKIISMFDNEEEILTQEELDWQDDDYYVRKLDFDSFNEDIDDSELND